MACDLAGGMTVPLQRQHWHDITHFQRRSDKDLFA